MDELLRKYFRRIVFVLLLANLVCMYYRVPVVYTALLNMANGISDMTKPVGKVLVDWMPFLGKFFGQ